MPNFDFSKSKPKKWYKRKEVQALMGLGLLAVGYLPEIAGYGIDHFIPQHTFVYQFKGLITAGLGIVLTALGLRGVKFGYKANNLPTGVTKVMDKLPNSITGIKGEDLKEEENTSNKE